jgi:ribosomal RNA assembly protein
LCVIDLREFAGKSSANVERIKGRIIGEGGRARRNMENLTGTHISVYGRTVSIIGDGSKLRSTIDAISSISGGSMHGAVYSKLEAVNRKEKYEKMKLWED